MQVMLEHVKGRCGISKVITQVGRLVMMQRRLEKSKGIAPILGSIGDRQFR